MNVKRNVASADVEAIKTALLGTQAKVFGPSDKDFAATLKSWSRAADRPAGVSVVPTTAEEVSVVVKYAADHGLDLAVKGGGHSTSGSSSTDGGVLINLSSMRNVKVDPNTQLAYIQGGCRWSDVDLALWEHKLATVGGTVSDTGVGGLTLGGGYGHLTGKHGLTIDQMVSATVVLADGSIVIAGQDNLPDLFWALKGAGQNFGVTTEFVLQGHPQEEAWMGMMVFPPTPHIVAGVLKAAKEIYEILEDQDGQQRTRGGGRCSNMINIMRLPATGDQTMMVVLSIFDGSEEEGKQFLKPFSDLEPVANTMAMQPFHRANNQWPAMEGLRVSMKGAAWLMPPRPEFFLELISRFDDFVTQVPDAAAQSLVGLEFYDTIKESNLDAGCFANRGRHLNALIMPAWKDKANDAACRQWARDISFMFNKLFAITPATTTKETGQENISSY